MNHTSASIAATQTLLKNIAFGKGFPPGKFNTGDLPPPPPQGGGPDVPEASPNPEPTLRQLNEFAVMVGQIHEQATQDVFMGQADEAIRRLGDAVSQIELKLLDTTTPNFRLGLKVMLFDTLKALQHKVQDKLKIVLNPLQAGIPQAIPDISSQPTSPQTLIQRSNELHEQLSALQQELLFTNGIVRS